MNKRRHNFLCVGFPKCGTTTLHEILVQHRDIYLPLIKEPIYYDNNKFLKKGFEWYINRYYPKQMKQNCIGEINPTIIVRDNAKRIRKDFGSDLKLLFVMRNPVDRLFSHYKHWLREESMVMAEYKNLTYGQQFDKFVRQNFSCCGKEVRLSSTLYKRMIVQGNYCKIIESYLKYFELSNMKFMYFEELVKNPRKVCLDVYQFLGLKEDKRVNYNIHANEGKRVARNIRSLHIHQAFYEIVWLNYLLHFPFMNDFLTKLLIRLENLIMTLTTKDPEDHSSMSQESRTILQDYYRPEKEGLERLLNLPKGELWYQ